MCATWWIPILWRDSHRLTELLSHWLIPTLEGRVECSVIAMFLIATGLAGRRGWASAVSRKCMCRCVCVQGRVHVHACWCMHVCSHLYGGQSVVPQDLPILCSRRGPLPWSLLTRTRLHDCSQALRIHLPPPLGLLIMGVYYRAWLGGDPCRWCWLWGLQQHGLVADEHRGLQIHSAHEHTTTACSRPSSLVLSPRFQSPVVTSGPKIDIFIWIWEGA